MKVYVKGSDEAISEHFKAREMDCPCDQCSHTFIDKSLIPKLEAFRSTIGQLVTITSGYRCEYHQRQLKEQGAETAVGISQHTLGRAADLKSDGKTGLELAVLARNVGFKAVGIGKSFIHADLRDDKDRRWFYSY